MSAHHHPSDPSQPRRLSDAEIIQVHDHAGEETTDDGGNYKLLPLVMLFLFSGLIFFGGTYIGAFSGHFAPTVHDERGTPMAKVAEVKIDVVALGKRQYVTCAGCHQPTGLGLPTLFPPLAKSEYVTGSEERLVRIVLSGLSGPVTVVGQQFGATAASTPMPSFGSNPGGLNWSDDNIAAVLTYVRQEWGNSAPAITAAKVAEIRAKVGNRGAWTITELEAALK